jgi:hypothetical protein
MRRFAAIVLSFTVLAAAQGATAQETVRRLAVREYREHMKAGWIGQMCGVGWGGPTEFRYKGQIIPEDKMPKWEPKAVNQFNQDDIYVEMTFVRTMEQHGLYPPLRQAGIDFANSGYPLWHANRAGRDNLRAGIAPPDSGHPKFNKHADDIDYQIEADYSGLVAPGLPNTVIRLGEIFGRLMNYGDGLYGGQFVGGMYAEAFFEKDPVKIVEAGLRCIPAQSQYAECIRDVLAWYRENPDDWQKTWEKIEAKYNDDPAYRKFTCDSKNEHNIDAKINGAYIVMGVLYGKRDPDQTTIIATRCGQDSDCNPSSALGILFATMRFSELPERFTSALDESKEFSHTAYNFPRLIEVCEKLARQAVVDAGGRIEKDANGEEVFVIPVRDSKPTPLEQCWEPAPAANVKFTEEEMKQIKVEQSKPAKDISAAVNTFAPGWKVAGCGGEMEPGVRAARGREKVLVTHPLNRETACVLSRTVEIPAGQKTALHLVVGHHEQGDWALVVKADGKELLRKTIGKESSKDGWEEVAVDLSPYAGKAVSLELLNRPTGWSYEAAFWGKIALASE